MERPLKTRIFLDSGDPADTKTALDLLGYLDGQTTNPSLVAKNPKFDSFDRSEGLKAHSRLMYVYKEIIHEIAELIPDGDISIEVYADDSTNIFGMIEQAVDLATWTKNYHVKLPSNTAGIASADALVQEGIRVNMTLCFSQEQAAAVHLATQGAKQGDVIISPFVGRLDDKGYCGMDLIRNIQEMYKKFNSHVDLLVASVRSLEHFLFSLYLEVDIITTPLNILKEWVDAGKPLPGRDIPLDKFEHLEEFFPEYPTKHIHYKEFDKTADYRMLDMENEMTDDGIYRFASDWNRLLLPKK